jgi:HK97 gp10 family phage protein
VLSDKAAAILARLNAIPKAVREAVKPALDQSGSDIVEAIRAAAPKDTGALAESIKATPKAGQDTAIAITAGDSGAPYARFVEFGTVHAPAHPFFWPTYRALKDGVKNNVETAIDSAVKDFTG